MASRQRYIKDDQERSNNNIRRRRRARRGIYNHTNKKSAMPNPISRDDLNAITHINYVTNDMHSLVDDIYEDLMERDHEGAKEKANNAIRLMNDLIKSLTDEV